MLTAKRWLDNPVGIISCTAIGYFIFAILSQRLIYNHNYACAFWPSAGIAMFAVVMRGKWGLVGTAIGTVVESIVIFSEQLPTDGWKVYVFAGITAIGNCVEVVLLAWLVNRMFDRGTDIMENFGKQIGFIIGALVCSFPSAICGVLMGCVFGVFEWTRFASDIALWTIGDTFGILTVVPFLLVTLTNRSKSELEDAAQWTWGISLLIAVAFLAGLGFWIWPAATYLILVVVVLGCFYLHQGWILAGVSLVSAIAVAATVRKVGPLAVIEQRFIDGQLVDVLSELPTAIGLYSFLFTLCMIGLCVSTAAARRLRRAKAAEITRQAVEVAESELLAISPVGIGWSVFDSETGHFVKVSEVLALEFGYSNAREMQDDISGAKSIYVHPSDRDELKAFLRSNPGRTYDKFIEMKKKEGHHLWIHLYARDVVKDGRRMILGFAKDVTAGTRRRTYHQIIQTVTNSLRITDPKKFWVSECLAKANAPMGGETKISLGREIRIWLALNPLKDKHSIGDFRRYGSVASHEKTTTRISALQIIESESQNLNTYCSVIMDDEKVFGVIIVDTPHWLFTPNAADLLASEDPSQTDDVSLASLRQTIGLMISQAFWREIAEERYKLVFELSPLGMFYADPKGNGYLYNDKALEINRIVPTQKGKGYLHANTVKEVNGILQGEEWDWLGVLTEGCRGRLEKEWKQLEAECKADPEGVKRIGPRHFREYHKPRGDETTVRLIDVYVQPIIQDQKCIGYMGTLQDNTEIEYDKAKGDYVRVSFGHDAGRSLGSIDGALSELNINHFPFNDHQRSLIKRIEKSKQALSWLAKISHESIEFNPYDTIQLSIDEIHNVRPLTDVEGNGNCSVLGRADLFQKIFDNLITNAFKYCMKDSRVTVEIQVSADSLTLTVTNVQEKSKASKYDQLEPTGSPYTQESTDELLSFANYSDIELLIELASRQSQKGLIICRLAARSAGGELEFERRDDKVIATMHIPVTHIQSMDDLHIREWWRDIGDRDLVAIHELLETIAAGQGTLSTHNKLCDYFMRSNQQLADRMANVVNNNVAMKQLCNRIQQEYYRG